MTRTEHLLTIAGEECAELQQRCSKALRFGLDEIQPGQDLDNKRRMRAEYADLIAVMQMLGIDAESVPIELIVAKRRKVEEFLRYSEQCGTMTPDPRGGDSFYRDHFGGR